MYKKHRRINFQMRILLLFKEIEDKLWNLEVTQPLRCSFWDPVLLF